MEIKDIKEKKKALESNIVNLIREFENETETTVNRIGSTRALDALGQTKQLYIQVDVEI